MHSEQLKLTYAEACEAGRHAADDCFHRMQQGNNLTLIGQVVRAAVDRGTYEGFEIGFFHQLSQRLITQ